jgi:hypothetical protein
MMSLAQATGLTLILLAAASHAPGANPDQTAEKHFNLAAEAFAEKAYTRAAKEIRLGSSFSAGHA